MGGDTFEVTKAKATYPKLAAKPVGQWIPHIYKDRIGQFYAGGQYEHQNLRAYVKTTPIEFIQH
jgi:alpha-mannosidase